MPDLIAGARIRVVYGIRVIDPAAHRRFKLGELPVTHGVLRDTADCIGHLENCRFPGRPAGTTNRNAQIGQPDRLSISIRQPRCGERDPSAGRIGNVGIGHPGHTVVLEVALPGRVQVRPNGVAVAIEYRVGSRWQREGPLGRCAVVAERVPDPPRVVVPAKAPGGPRQGQRELLAAPQMQHAASIALDPRYVVVDPGDDLVALVG